jgi:DegV family protein with EDD domain
MAVAVVTDSTADIPSKVVDELGITIVPLYVQFGKESYRDSVDLTGGEFYYKLVHEADYPKTSTPNINDFATIYNELAKKTKEIISIHIGPKISATYNMAVAAAKEVEPDCCIELVDSQTTIMALGLLVIEAAKAAREGMGLDQLADMVRKLIPKAHVLVTCDTVKYLVRGGHANKAVKVLLASALRINPLIEIKEEVLPFGRVRGRAKAIDALCKYVGSFPHPRSLAVEYATNAEEAKSLVARLERMLPGVPVYTSIVGAVVGAHLGPHTLAVSILEQ